MAKSPFPGMDPYLESRWESVQGGLCYLTMRELQPQLPSTLRARYEQRVPFEDADLDADQQPHYRPDASVSEYGGVAVVQRSEVATRTTATPTTYRWPDTRPKRRWVQIIDLANKGRVVTVIEFLSPSNKSAGAGNLDYRKKLQDYLDADVSIVEVDLLRSSRQTLLIPWSVLGLKDQRDYLVSVSRSWDREQWEIFSISIRERLPLIPIPLRQSDADISLDLQAVIDQAYLDYAFDDINYALPCEPPLKPEDELWARQLLAARSAT